MATDAAPSKRPLRHACYSCQRAHAFCDQERPCGRCVKAGIGAMCFDTEMKKRGRKPANETARQRALQDAVHDGRLTLPQRSGMQRIENISSQEVSPEDLNLVLLNELRELKANQRRLHEELQRLKANELNSMPYEQSTALQKASAATAAPPPVNDKAIVIYDLTKLPATVKTANETFCRMLGYDMQEVLGQPWTKFVHPAYHERVKQIFNTRPLSTIIEFDLVYRHRNGGLFSTFDSHTIIFAADGTPVSDLVAIKLNPHPMAAPSPVLASSARPTPLLTGEVTTTPVTSSAPSSRHAALMMPDDVDTNTHRFHTLSLQDASSLPPSSRPISVPGRSPFAPSPPASPMALSTGLSAGAPSALSHWPEGDGPATVDAHALLSASPSRFLALSGDDPLYTQASSAMEVPCPAPGTCLCSPHTPPQPEVMPLPLPAAVEVPDAPEPLRISPLLRASTDEADLQVNDEELMQLLSSDITGAASTHSAT